MGPPDEGSIRRPIAPRANALTTELHLAPLLVGADLSGKKMTGTYATTTACSECAR